MHERRIGGSSGRGMVAGVRSGGERAAKEVCGTNFLSMYNGIDPPSLAQNDRLKHPGPPMADCRAEQRGAADPA